MAGPTVAQVPNLNDGNWQIIESNAVRHLYSSPRGFWGVVMGRSNTFAPPPLVAAPVLTTNLWPWVNTNIFANTNGRVMAMYATNIWVSFTNPPITVRATSNIFFGAVGFTAVSVHNQLNQAQYSQAAFGQLQSTLLTRRHVMFRGHGAGATGTIQTNATQPIVWFITETNSFVEMKIRGQIGFDSGGYDYTIAIMTEDAPLTLEPMPLLICTNVQQYLTFVLYPNPDVSWGSSIPFYSCQHNVWGTTSEGLAGWWHNNWIGGDSGSPNVIALPHPTRRFTLALFQIRSGSLMSQHQLNSMDALTTWANLNPASYQPTVIQLEDYLP